MSILINNTQFDSLSGQIISTGQSLQSQINLLSNFTGHAQTGIGQSGYIAKFTNDGSGINRTNLFVDNSGRIALYNTSPVSNIDLSGHFKARDITGQILAIYTVGNTSTLVTNSAGSVGVNRLDVGFGWYALEQGVGGGIGFGSGHSISWKATTTSTNNVGDLYLYRDNANQLGLRSGVNAAQSFNVYNKYGNPLNYERGYIRWSGDNFDIGNANGGLGTGVDRRVNVQAGTELNLISANNNTGINISGNTVKINNFAVISGLVLSGQAPSAANSIGFSGQMMISGMFLYIATGNNLWGKVTIGSF